MCIVLWCYGSAEPSGWSFKFIGKRTMEDFLANKKDADVMF